MECEHNHQALEAARSHLTIVARGLVFRFGPDLAAASLAGALVGVVEEAHGREAAVRWLSELANELDNDDATPPPVGHA